MFALPCKGEREKDGKGHCKYVHKKKRNEIKKKRGDKEDSEGRGEVDIDLINTRLETMVRISNSITGFSGRRCCSIV